MPHVIAVRKLITMTKSKNIRNIQYHSFHGIGYRDVEKKIYTRINYHDEVIPPLHIVRDGNHLPPITQCCLYFVVNAQIKALLERVPNVRFEQVIFDKIVDFFYEKGDFRIYRKAERIDVRELQLAQPDVPKLHARIGSHYEVLTQSQADIVHEFPDAVEIRFGEDGWDLVPDEPLLKLSEPMLAKYPLHHFEHHWTIMSPALFAVLEPFFDFDFFLKERIEY